ncbi:MAG: N-acetylmuramoyl-L-alanine amidase [Verrucomicrobiota bacterium JB023]|nr:N-acetylmuramoyl-L-alanine amidase [Verrucomicrobiota bacterium JB023]
MRRYLPLAIIVIILISATVTVLMTRRGKDPEPAPTDQPVLSDLAIPPNWQELERYQQTIDRDTFERLLTSFYSLPGAWTGKLSLNATAVEVVKQMAQPDETYSLAYADASEPLPRLPALDDLHIAIDPGHIGGEFAEIEQRNFDPTPDDPTDIPVREGDLTLLTAKHLKPRLEALGATVTLVRDEALPVTDTSPDDFLADHPDRRTAEQLFYRTAEIRARADLINHVIQPDLVLCLHYNADAWYGENPWARDNHFHLILHGAYMEGELALDDQRFEMMRHLLTRTSEQVLALAQTISDHFLAETDLIPFHYRPTAPAIQMDPLRPIYARNLLANRLYQAPTIFLEPYVMNHRDTFARVQEGDHDGLRLVNGELRPSLPREYAMILAEAIRIHFEERDGSPES